MLYWKKAYYYHVRISFFSVQIGQVYLYKFGETFQDHYRQWEYLVMINFQPVFF